VNATVAWLLKPEAWQILAGGWGRVSDRYHRNTW